MLICKYSPWRYTPTHYEAARLHMEPCATSSFSALTTLFLKPRNYFTGYKVDHHAEGGGGQEPPGINQLLTEPASLAS